MFMDWKRLKLIPRGEKVLYLEERRQVLNTAREISQNGMVIGTWGNVSARCNDDLMVITPSGVKYDSLTMEDIVIVDSTYGVIEGSLKPSSEAPMHMGIYQKRSDVNAIVHVHSIYATAFAVARKNIPVILEETAQVIGHEVPVADYALCGTYALAETVVKALGEEKKAVLLANHGLVAVGASMAEALRICYVVEKTSRVAIYARGIGEINSLPEAQIKELNHKFKSYGQNKKPDL